MCVCGENIYFGVLKKFEALSRPALKEKYMGGNIYFVVLVKIAELSWPVSPPFPGFSPL